MNTDSKASECVPAPYQLDPELGRKLCISKDTPLCVTCRGNACKLMHSWSHKSSRNFAAVARVVAPCKNAKPGSVLSSIVEGHAAEEMQPGLTVGHV